MRRVLVLLLTALLLGGGALAAVAAARPAKRHGRDAVVRERPSRVTFGRAWVLAQQPRTTPVPTAAPSAPALPTPPAPSSIPIDGPPSPPAVVPVAPSDPPVVPSVGVTLRDTPAFTAQLSRTSVAAGSVRVQLVNRGEDDHDLRVERADGTGTGYDVPRTPPTQTATTKVTLDAGAWVLFCTLPGHRAAGMSATLTVTAP